MSTRGILGLAMAITVLLPAYLLLLALFFHAFRTILREARSRPSNRLPDIVFAYFLLVSGIWVAILIPALALQELTNRGSP